MTDRPLAQRLSDGRAADTPGQVTSVRPGDNKEKL